MSSPPDSPQDRARLPRSGWVVPTLGLLLVRSSGRQALRQALPFYFGLLMVAFILFAGNGLNAATVTSAAGRSPVTGVGLLAVWVVATMPATRALLHDRRVQFLKSLPVGERPILVILAALLTVAELPWILLWARGSGLLEAGCASFVALTLRTLWLAQPWSALRSLLAIGLLAGWATRQTSRLALLPGSMALFVFALRWAWRRSPDEVTQRSRWWVGGRPAVALASAHLATVVRSSSVVVVRSVLLTSVAATFSFLLVRNNEAHHWPLDLQRLEAVYVPVAVLPIASLGGPMLRVEHAAAWLLEANAVALFERRRALTLALALANASIAAVYAIALGSALDLTAARLVQLCCELTGIAIAFAVIGEGAVRFAVNDQGHDGARLILLTIVFIMVAESAIVAMPRVGSAGWLMAAVVCLIYRRRRAAGAATVSSQGARA